MAQHLNQPVRVAELAAADVFPSHNFTLIKAANLAAPARYRDRRKTSMPVGRFRQAGGHAESSGKCSETFDTAQQFSGAFNHQHQHES